MASSGENESAAELALSVEKGLLELNGKRFLWSCDLRDRVIEDWKTHFNEFQGLIETAHRAVVQLRSAGHTAEAEHLAMKMLSQQRLQDPANFEIRVYTGYGFEKFTIVGSDEMQEAWDNGNRFPTEPSATAVQRESLPQRREATTIGCPNTKTQSASHSGHKGNWDAARLLTLAEPVAIEWTPQLPPLTVQEAIQGGTWISCTKSGTAFCIECECPRLMLPDVGSGKHDLLARHFHTDPFQDDTALIHFLKVHREGFKNGATEMIQKHGRRVNNDGPGLHRLAIAASNLSVKLRYDDLVSTWSKWTEKYQSSGTRSQRSRANRILQLDRWIESKVLLKDERPFVFPWPEPESQDWTVICTHPECTSPFFSHHPFQKSRAVDHFRSHGLHLDEFEVIQLFGFKVKVRNPKQRKADSIPITSQFRVAPDRDDKSLSEMEGAKPEQEQPTPLLTPALFNGVVDYYKYSAESLYTECKRRGMVFNGSFPLVKKNVLIKKLKLDDGLQDFNDTKTWPFDRLKSECRDRGLPDDRKRDTLIKQLESHEAKLRQQAAQTQQAVKEGIDLAVPASIDVSSNIVQQAALSTAPESESAVSSLQGTADNGGQEIFDHFSHLNPKTGAAEDVTLTDLSLNTRRRPGRPKKGETSIPMPKSADLPIRTLPLRSSTSLGLSRPENVQTVKEV